MDYQLTPELLSPDALAAAKADAAKVLRDVADTLSAPHSWTQGCDARDARGNPVGPAAPTAVRWCLMGALNRHLMPHRLAAGILARSALAQATAPVQTASFNDGARRASEVVAVARAAAQSLEV